MRFKIISILQFLNKKTQILFNQFIAVRKFNIYKNSQNLPKRGNALLVYIVYPFYLKETDASFRAHINVWNARMIVQVLNDLGFCVDVIDYHDKFFETAKKYDLIIGIGEAFDSEKLYFKNSSIKIYYATGMHYLAETNLIYHRNLNFRDRKGKFISPKRINTPYFSPEKSDYIISIQNGFTNKTYSHLNIPIYALTLSGTESDFSKNLLKNKNTKTILWLSGSGMVLKGLDLVLDAIKQLDDCRLIICADTSDDEEFVKIYHNELFGTRNITLHGFVDIGSPEFQKIIEECVAVIYPYPEGEISGSLMTCMNHGLIPIIAYFSNSEIAEFAEYVDGTVKGIKETLSRFIQLPDEIILEKSRKSLEYVRRYHSREKEYSDWKSAFEDIVEKSNLFKQPK